MLKLSITDCFTFIIIFISNLNSVKRRTFLIKIVNLHMQQQFCKLLSLYHEFLWDLDRNRVNFNTMFTIIITFIGRDKQILQWSAYRSLITRTQSTGFFEAGVTLIKEENPVPYLKSYSGYRSMWLLSMR